jgi:hypothetical protein
MILTQRQLDVLNHVVMEGQAWADNSNEASMLAKVARHEGAYDEAVAKGSYKNRTKREEASEKVRQDRYDNAPYSVKRQRSYPHIGDQLDALWKGGDDAAAMKVIVDKVKSDNPKG